MLGSVAIPTTLVNQLVKSYRMVLACTMFTGTYMSGQPTGWDVFSDSIPNRTVIRPVPTASIVGVTGSITRIVCRRRIAAAVRQPIAADTSAFGSLGPTSPPRPPHS